MSSCSTVKILGVDFFVGGTSILDAIEAGGLVQVPSGPGLADDFSSKSAYRRALLEADFVIPDSGLMVLLWNWLIRPKGMDGIQRYSGLKLLRELLLRPSLHQEGATFWVMPSSEERDRSVNWLKTVGISVAPEDSYIAPFYRAHLEASGEVEDPLLLSILVSRRPRYIFISVGSGVQEQLGWYLRRHLPYRPAILCTGAAISFLSGGQARIPAWADRFYLGWIFRIANNPIRFGRRYLGAFKLIPMMLKYRGNLPKESI